MTSLISPDDHWVIWTSLVGVSALSLYLEQNYSLFQKITGALVAMVGGMILSNIGFLPTESPSYDIVWDYIIPLTIPLLLMKTDIRRIVKETGRMFWAFHLSALGTVLGSVVAVVLLHSLVPSLERIVPAMTGSYIGGSVNFVALVATFEPPEDLVNATIVADNGIMAIYFLILIALPSSVFVRKLFPANDKTISFTTQTSDQKNGIWGAQEISLLDIASVLSIAFAIATLSVKISDYCSNPSLHFMVRSLLGQKYILLTTFAVAFPMLFPKYAKQLNGSEVLGAFFIFIFFTMIGIPASLKTVFLEAPTMILFCAIVLAGNFLTTFALGKLFKFELEELVLAAVVTSGGPMNGAAIATSKGWHALVVPSLLIGVWGYVIGNYTGYLVGALLGVLF
ncbi:hypothetical protein CA13_16960 [Planctomycetes bacterium CA13]|uniref:DUF819 domain-containing protein n=1 Tax=Novipirellula herctigrandis TaxID=2527986 RepID=A0A5C5Z0R5_9BACT|nr:hypothetical protein CA13_16960 [Planctomycetes bacterium CA13]